MISKIPAAVSTMSELCKGMEWPVLFSTLMLYAMNDWSPFDPVDDPLILDSESEEPQSGQGLGSIDLKIALPLQSIEKLSKFLTEINKLEDLQKQAAQSFEVRL